MEKNNKNSTIKDILNKSSIKEDFTDNSKALTSNDKNSNLDSEIHQKQNDSSNNINNDGESINTEQYSNNERDDNNSGTFNNNNNINIDIMVLNELSKSCHLAMNNISFLSKHITNKNMKKTLVSVYSQYAHILLQVDQQFEKYCEIPENISNSIKMMGICGIRMNMRFDRSNSHIAEIMIQGETMGIIKCQKLLNNNLEIDDSTTDLLNAFKDFQKENIVKLNSYL